MKAKCIIKSVDPLVNHNRLEDGSKGAAYLNCSIELVGVLDKEGKPKTGPARVYQTTISKLNNAGKSVIGTELECRAEMIGDNNAIAVTVYAPGLNTWDVSDFLADDDDEETVESAEPVSADFDEE